MHVGQLLRSFNDIFGSGANRVFFAPGRINLIGEHTDYNGGHVFPCAITFGTYAVARRREDRLVRLYSLNFEHTGVMEFNLDRLEYDIDHDWANYPKGMIRYVKEAGHSVESGMDVLFYGNIPNGAGLSSSASIELATGVMLQGLFNLSIDRIDLVKTGQKVENEFIGVNSGIMDQFAIGMGRKGAGILLDTNTLRYEYAPIDLEDHSIIIMNSNKRRELAGSKYNERRTECESALQSLQSVTDIGSLGELTEEEFELHKHVIQDSTERKRAKHAVYENRRTLQALQYLKNDQLQKFGELMNASHISLRDDYEVTGKELDALVEAAWEQPGVVGARMTGAGFGGCAIAIVERDCVEGFIDAVAGKYEEAVGYEATFYVADIGNGATELDKEVIV
ncbi:galactokinase [Rossellomorea vietnamensis]|uniref:Galactokinase n=1 Tax=Rossellomorea vietnamensis TaxID=218284 RepID=A0ACD4C3Y5_9BACI|nr:galactokinase [Rossellomorea vietnamensis]UXH43365.1 galactokinase [Rossellomorea vietnamensis]